MKKLKTLSVIVVYGAPGSGKTTVADFLHEELSNCAHIGVDHIKRFISEFREVPTHQGVSKSVISAMVGEYLKQNISVIVEQGMTRYEIENLKTLADSSNTSFFAYSLLADKSVRDSRIEERTTKLGKPTIPKDVIDELSKVFADNDYHATKVFDTGKVSTREVADQILREISE